MAIEVDARGYTDASEPADVQSETTLVAQAETTAETSTETAPPQTIVIEVGEGSILRLPAGTSVDEPRVNGSNLEFVQPDGTVIVVPNGAITGLTIFIGNTVIPPIAVAALFEDNGIETAAGPDGGDEESGGGNFAEPVPDIGPGLPWGPLLPPTGLAFGRPEQPERFAALIEETETPNGLPSFTSADSLE